VREEQEGAVSHDRKTTRASRFRLSVHSEQSSHPEKKKMTESGGLQSERICGFILGKKIPGEKE